jgi:hypothetical protein
MAIDVNLAASHITASLISSNSISVKGSDDQDTIKNAVTIHMMVFTELTSVARKGISPYNE